jgi:hypothetical protein
MGYLRFSPPEYDAIVRVALWLDAVPRPHALQHVLVAALADADPALADRLSRLRPGELLPLYEHLYGLPRPAGQQPLTAEEVAALADAFGPLVWHARFAGPLKPALVLRLLEQSPALAEKLHHLSPDQFESLCQQVRQRLQREA